MSPKHLLISVALRMLSYFSLSIDPTTAQLIDPAPFYTMVELVCWDGYSIQEYEVLTEDGYVLTIHRIPNGKRRPRVSSKINHYQQIHSGYHSDFAECVNESLSEIPSGPPVLLAHGLFGASDNWVLQGPGYDLAYLLADAGYDVWFSNIRGNFYSKAHTNLSTSNPKFWDFSFHENGVYDMPAIIDFILQATNSEKLFYIGHSMGTTMYFIMTSVKPEYNDKIQFFFGMTPLGQIKLENLSPARQSSLGFAFRLAEALRSRGVLEVFPRNSILSILAKIFCGKGSPLQDSCYDLIFASAGYHSRLFLRHRFPLIVTHGLGGNSIKTFTHYIQLLNSPTFRYFDYSPDENFRRYGQQKPPDYDLNKVTSPIAFYYSHHDYIVDPKDVQLLVNALPNVVKVESVPKYSHVDFIWAYNAKYLLYSKILALMDKFRIQ